VQVEESWTRRHRADVARLQAGITSSACRRSARNGWRWCAAASRPGR
jgi:hypothetical protein